jgi:hypothetical protein
MHKAPKHRSDRSASDQTKDQGVPFQFSLTFKLLTGGIAVRLALPPLFQKNPPIAVRRTADRAQ